MSKKYSLASSSWDHRELNAAIDVLKSGNCTMGEKTKKLEQEFADYFGSKYCVMSNSGSSANLLAITALMYRKNKPLKKGDVVLVPTVSWSTTYYPLHQNGLVMKFIDIDPETLNISPEKILENLTPEVKAVFAVNLLGNPCDYEKICKICNDHNLILIEDNCESMGAYAQLYGQTVPCGGFGIMGTFSGFFSHHICTVEGGFTITDDLELYQIMISLRAHGWTRGLPDQNFVHDKDGVQFNDLFRFVLPGYNLRPNDIFAAIGSEQLIKLADLLDIRTKNANRFLDGIVAFNKKRGKIVLRPQKIAPGANSSWFGFAITLEEELAGRRKEITDVLIANDIECRPIVAGNFSKNPVIKHMECIKTTDTHAAKIDQDGLFIGNTHADLSEQLEYFFKVMDTF